MSQRAQVENLLRKMGAKGIHTHELRHIYIANPSQRIAELERRGWVIHHTREKLNGDAWGTRYRLIYAPLTDAGRGALPVTDVAHGQVGPPDPQSAPSSVDEEQEIPQLFEVAKAEEKSVAHWEAA